MNRFMNWFANEESGQGMVEHGLIIALVSIVVIAALTLVGGKLTAIFQKIANTLKA